MTTRCRWCTDDPLYIAYHDAEWGVAIHDDIRWFELITLEGAQAGLSWFTVLRKRERYREQMYGFDPGKLAGLTDTDIERLLQDPGLIRNRLKIASVRDNARAFLEIQNRHGSFDAWIWGQIGGAPIMNDWKNISQVPTSTKESDKLSHALREQGFRFVGSTICYALMQAGGLVMDHTVDCFRYKELRT
ncbi:MAG: DNA-3-methyladenine glycosylase I [Aquisalimonadaceae bacterium]